MNIQSSVSVFQICPILSDVIAEGKKQVSEKSLESKHKLTDCISPMTSWWSCLLTFFTVILLVVNGKNLEQIFKLTGIDWKLVLRIRQEDLLVANGDWLTIKQPMLRNFMLEGYKFWK